jgi:hypothetical protein
MKKYTELLTTPVALIMLLIFNLIGERLGWHLYGIEVLQKLFIGLVLFLAIVGLSRLVFRVQFPQLYQFISNDFDKENKWNALTNSQKTVAGLCIFLLFCLILALLVSNL